MASHLFELPRRDTPAQGEEDIFASNPTVVDSPREVSVEAVRAAVGSHPFDGNRLAVVGRLNARADVSSLSVTSLAETGALLEPQFIDDYLAKKALAERGRPGAKEAFDGLLAEKTKRLNKVRSQVSRIKGQLKQNLMNLANLVFKDVQEAVEVEGVNLTPIDAIQVFKTTIFTKVDEFLDSFVAYVEAEAASQLGDSERNPVEPVDMEVLNIALDTLVLDEARKLHEAAGAEAIHLAETTQSKAAERLAAQEAAREDRERERGLVEAVNTTFDAALDSFTHVLEFEKGKRRGRKVGLTSTRSERERSFVVAVMNLAKFRMGEGAEISYASQEETDEGLLSVIAAKSEEAVNAAIAFEKFQELGYTDQSVELASLQAIDARDQAIRAYRQYLFDLVLRNMKGAHRALLDEILVELGQESESRLMSGNEYLGAFLGVVESSVRGVLGEGASATVDLQPVLTAVQLMRGSVREDTVRARDEMVSTYFRGELFPQLQAACENAVARATAAASRSTSTPAPSPNVSVTVDEQDMDMIAQRVAGLLRESPSRRWLGRLGWLGAGAGLLFAAQNLRMPELDPASEEPAEAAAPAEPVPVAPVEAAPTAIAPVAVESPAPTVWYRLPDESYTGGTGAQPGPWYAELQRAAGQDPDGSALAVLCIDGKPAKENTDGRPGIRHRFGVDEKLEWDTPGQDVKGFQAFPEGQDIYTLCNDKKSGTFGTILVRD